MKKFVLVSSTSGSNKAVSQSGDITQLGATLAAEHQWVTVINPTNYRLLLQACDNCGVVKSENSVLRMCRASKGQAIVSRSMSTQVQLVG